jgi:hypothetical protein
MIVADEHAGKKVRCPDCKAILTVPVPAPADPFAFLAPSAPAAAPPPVTSPPAPPAATPPPATAEDRLAALERENAALRLQCARIQWSGIAASIVLAVLAGLPWVLHPPGSVQAAGPRDGASTEVSARRFVVKDGRGAVRAALGVEAGDVVSLKLFFEGAKEQITVIGGPDAGLNVYDRRGDLRLQAGTTGDGSPSLALRAKELKPKIQLGVRANDVPFFDLYDANDQAFPLVAKDGTPVFSRAAP